MIFDSGLLFWGGGLYSICLSKLNDDYDDDDDDDDDDDNMKYWHHDATNVAFTITVATVGYLVRLIGFYLECLLFFYLCSWAYILSVFTSSKSTSNY